MASYKDFMNARLAQAQANRASRNGQVPAAPGNSANMVSNYNNIGINPMVAPMMNARARTSVMPNNQMQPNAISPAAFSSQDTIKGVFGQSNPGTFTRSIGAAPLMQMDDQAYMPVEDPTMMTADIPLDGYGEAQMPPMDVQTPITPTYDLNNL